MKVCLRAYESLWQFSARVYISHRFQESSLTEEHQLSVTLFDTEVLIDGRLLVEEGVCGKCGEDVHREVENAPVP